jgi:hypothetical protein
MSEEHDVSRRAALRIRGAVGAVTALDAALQATPASAPAALDSSGATVIDVAVGRMAKGHS